MFRICLMSPALLPKDLNKYSAAAGYNYYDRSYFSNYQTPVSNSSVSNYYTIKFKTITNRGITQSTINCSGLCFGE
jgi:hypothetical protein